MPINAKGTETMLQEAIKYISDKADEQAKIKAEAKSPKLLKDWPTDGRSFFYEHNGELKTTSIPAGLRSHSVTSVEDIVRAAKLWNANPVLWIADRSLVLLIDDGDRRERVTLPLIESAVFKRIKGLASNGKLDQADFIRLLRVELRNAANQGEILAAVRKIKFRKLQEGQTTIQHGDESMGSLIEAQVTGAAAIPEMLTVSTNLFSNPGEETFAVSIGLDLEIDTTNQKFVLRPIPDEIEKVTAAALAEIRARIEAELPDLAIFYGTP